MRYLTAPLTVSTSTQLWPRMLESGNKLMAWGRGVATSSSAWIKNICTEWWDVKVPSVWCSLSSVWAGVKGCLSWWMYNTTFRLLGPLKALCLLLISPLLYVVGKVKEVFFSFFLIFIPSRLIPSRFFPSRLIHNVKPIDENNPVWPDMVSYKHLKMSCRYSVNNLFWGDWGGGGGGG